MLSIRHLPFAKSTSLLADVHFILCAIKRKGDITKMLCSSHLIARVRYRRVLLQHQNTLKNVYNSQNVLKYTFFSIRKHVKLNIRQNICNYNSHRLDSLFFDIKIRKIIEFFNITNILATCKSSFQIGNCIFSLCFSPLVITKLTLLTIWHQLGETMLFLLSNLETRR